MYAIAMLFKTQQLNELCLLQGLQLENKVCRTIYAIVTVVKTQQLNELSFLCYTDYNNERHILC